jgi:hypothetical protein
MVVSLFVEETGVPGENYRPVASHRQTLSHNVVSSTPCHERDLNSDRQSETVNCPYIADLNSNEKVFMCT